MFSKLLTVFRVPELRRKILLTIGLLAVYRMGFSITLPFIDHAAIKEVTSGGGTGSGFGDMLKMVQVFSASNITNGSIFGLGIMPYITASIVFQLLGTVYPPLEQLQKEGESGRRRLNEYTRYATVIICILQSFFLIRGLAGTAITGQSMMLPGYDGLHWILTGTFVMTAGTVFLMWIGEQIDAYGIGNGISLLIMAGILARMPGTAGGFLSRFVNAEGGLQLGGGSGVEILLVLAVLFVTVIVWVIFITQGQRKIPIQSAKHVRGRKVMGGQRQWLPLRVNQAGVMPIIFRVQPAAPALRSFIFTQLYQIFWSENNVVLKEPLLGRIQALARVLYTTFRYVVTDLLLLLLLDCDHLQSERYGGKPEGHGKLYSGLPAWWSNRCSPSRAGDGPDHIRWSGIPGDHRSHSNDHLDHS